MPRARKKVRRRFVDPWADRNYHPRGSKSVSKRYTKGPKKFSRKLGQFIGK